MAEEDDEDEMDMVLQSLRLNLLKAANAKLEDNPKAADISAALEIYQEFGGTSGTIKRKSSKSVLDNLPFKNDE